MSDDPFQLEIHQPKGVDCASKRGAVCLGLSFDEAFEPGEACHAFGFVLSPDEARDLAERLFHAADDADAPDTLYIATEPD